MASIDERRHDLLATEGNSCCSGSRSTIDCETHVNTPPEVIDPFQTEDGDQACRESGTSCSCSAGLCPGTLLVGAVLAGAVLFAVGRWLWAVLAA